MLNKNVLSIKGQIQKLLESKNYYSISEIEPDFNHCFTEISFKPIDEGAFQIIDIINHTIFKTIQYSDIKDVDIDEILATIILNDNSVYFFKEIRTDLKEILDDFGTNINITKYHMYIDKNIENNEDELNYDMNYYFVLKDFECTKCVDDKKNNNLKISSDTGIQCINCDDIVSIEEEYGLTSNRDVKIWLTNEDYMVIESL